jgi:pimeloyl-[acyl-carrier protein] methyl ester esterase
MNQQWINKKQNQACILFFNGWGMDENAIVHMGFDGFDVCMFNDFRDIEPVCCHTSDYQMVILVAWSLGVWVAEQAISQSDITIHKSIAINGTSCPVHNQYGITENLFVTTMNGWNETNRNKFNRRMIGGKQSLEAGKQFLSNRSADDQKEELQAIYVSYKNTHHSHIHWDLAVVGQNDLIFPAVNQKNWWTEKTKIVETGFPHYPFIGLQQWSQLIIS